MRVPKDEDIIGHLCVKKNFKSTGKDGYLVAETDLPGIRTYLL